MMYLIWIVEVLAIFGVFWYKSKQPAMTKGEQFYEIACVSQRQNSFLMNTTQTPPYNGVESK